MMFLALFLIVLAVLWACRRVVLWRSERAARNAFGRVPRRVSGPRVKVVRPPYDWSKDER